MNMKPDGKINVIFCVDQAYYLQISVVMTSIMENNTSGRMVDFFIIESGFTDKEKKLVEEITKRYSCTVNFMPVDEHLHLFKDTSCSDFKNDYISLACYYRLLIFKIMPSDVHTCIYVDGDMIVNSDLSGLIDNMGETLLAAVPESVAMEKPDYYLGHLKDYKEFSKFFENPLQYPYFNAGFLVINLDKSREIGLWEELLEFYLKNPNLPYADQDLLNAVIGQGHSDLMNYLSPNYNVFCSRDINHAIGHKGGYFSQQETIEAYKNPKIYHYVGPEKPWSNPVSAYYEVWWHYAGISPAEPQLFDKLVAEFRKAHLGTPQIPQTFYVNVHNSREGLRGLLTRDPFVRTRFEAYCNHYPFPYTTDKMKRMLLLSGRLKAALLLNLNRTPKNAINAFSNCDRGLDELRRMIDTHDIISFDIFDTLICRIYSHPLDVFTVVENKSGLKGFKEARIEAERKVRADNPNLQEVSLDQIYGYMPSMMASAMDVEIETEISSVFCNKPIYEMVQYAKKQNKHVVFTSSMYLPEEVIRKMLEKCGYTDYSLFLSSSLGKSKKSGDLYRHVVERYGVSASKILHIGDNYEEDCMAAEEVGLHVFYVRKNIESLLLEDPHVALFNDKVRSISASTLMAILASFRSQDADYWHLFGRYFVGPVILAYVLWLYKQFRTDRRKTIAFIARDGYLLQKAMERLAPGEFDTHYVYAPRRISNICNMDFELKFRSNEVQSNSFADSVLKNYLDWDESRLKNTSLEEKERCVLAGGSEIERISNEITKEYSDYLAPFSDKERIAVVDSMTTNFSAQKLFEKVFCGKDIIGYYWVSLRHQGNEDQYGNRVQRSYVSSHVNSIQDWFIMEFAMTSPEPPVLDVKDGKPVYKVENDYDKARSDAFRKMEAGALEFIDQCIRLIPDLKSFSIESDVIEKYVNCWYDSPTKTDKEHFSKMKLPIDCEHESYSQMFEKWYR